MTVAKAYKDVTFTLVAGESYVDPETGEIVFKDDSLDVEIVDGDNDNPDCYLINVDYYVRLYKSRDSMLITARSNFGNVELYEKSIEESIENEFITFNGRNTISSDKIIKDNFIAIPVGKIYTLAGTEYSSDISAELNTNSITALEEIVGIYEISYLTKYDKYKFLSTRTGRMVIFFIGT